MTWASLDTAVMEGETAAVAVPLDGPPLAGLLYPAFATGGFAMTRASFDGLGVTPDASGDDALQDLLNRAALGGFSFALIPDPVVRLVTVDQWSRLRGVFAVEQGAAFQDRGAEVRVARAFRPAAADLADLAALQLGGSRNVSVVRAHSDEAYKALDNLRHRQAEYIAYLEAEHGSLSATIHHWKPSATTPRGPGQSTSLGGSDAVWLDDRKRTREGRAA